MTYDNWKTTEPEDQGEREPEMEEEPEQEMTTDDDRATLEKVQQYVDERLVFHAHLLNDEAVARHIAALRSAFSVPDAAQVNEMRRELFDVLAACGDAMNWARHFNDDDPQRSTSKGQALRAARALALEYAKAQEEMRSMRETIRGKENEAAQARREAIEEYRMSLREHLVETTPERAAKWDQFNRGVQECIDNGDALLSAQPAARGEMENDGPHYGRGDDGDRERQGRAAHAEPRQSVGPDSATPHPHEEDTMSHENPPPLDDAAIAAMYDRGANALSAIAQDAGDTNTIAWYRAQADRLRQPPAPAPEPDVQSRIDEVLDEPAQIAKEINGRASMMASMLRCALIERDQALAQLRARAAKETKT